MKYIAVIILYLVAVLGVKFLISALIDKGICWVFGITFISALIVKGICWAFGMALSWKLTIGIWLIASLLHAVFKINVNIKK